VAVGVQHAVLTFHIVIWLYKVFRHNLIKGTIFEKKKEKYTEHRLCVLITSTNLSERFLIIREIERDIIKNIYLDFL